MTADQFRPAPAPAKKRMIRFAPPIRRAPRHDTKTPLLPLPAMWWFPAFDENPHTAAETAKAATHATSPNDNRAPTSVFAVPRPGSPDVFGLTPGS